MNYSTLCIARLSVSSKLAHSQDSLKCAQDRGDNVDMWSRFVDEEVKALSEIELEINKCVCRLEFN